MELDKIIILCKKGKRKGQNLLYQQFSNAMFRICLRYVGNETEAEEILMNGFMKVFKNIKNFENRNKGSFPAWIKTIMVRESLDFLRRNKTMYFVEANDALQLESDTDAIQDLLAEDLFALIQEMPDGYRTVFNLYVIEGFSHQEIAEKLQISINTSKTQLRKARLFLQNELKKTELV